MDPNDPADRERLLLKYCDSPEKEFLENVFPQFKMRFKLNDGQAFGEIAMR